MKTQRHPNFYQLLIDNHNAEVVAFSMTPGPERSKGRTWDVSAVLRLKGYDIYMKGKFHGNLNETEETGQANLNIDKVRMYVEGGREEDYVDYTRASYKALMLIDGIYICSEYSSDVNRAVRELTGYNSCYYIGIPDVKEYARIFELGYKRIFSW